MVIYYNRETRDIEFTERDVMLPQLISGSTSEKIKLLEESNTGFVSVPYELNEEIFNYKVCLDDDGNFTGLQPKEIMYLDKEITDIAE